MLSLMPKLVSLSNLSVTVVDLSLDALKFTQVNLRPRGALAADNLFPLRKHWALYLESKPRRRGAKDVTKPTVALLSQLFAWREALTVVKPDTLICWHRQGFRMLGKWKSNPHGGPRVPVEIRNLIAEEAHENPTLGEESIDAELLLKSAIWVSPRTAGCYMSDDAGSSRIIERAQKKSRSQS
jgi:putative transposase